MGTLSDAASQIVAEPVFQGAELVGVDRADTADAALAVCDFLPFCAERKYYLEASETKNGVNPIMLAIIIGSEFGPGKLLKPGKGLLKRLGVDGLSTAGRAPAQGGRSAAGRSYQKHMDRGELPRVPGAQLDDAGQTLLDDILTDPGSTVHTVKAGGAAGGVRIVGTNGVGVTYNPDGTLAYFGLYP